jgi:prephenate dehydrogenase
MNKLVIVGLGLIGGSIARAARQRNLAREIIGLDLEVVEPSALGLDRAVKVSDPGADSSFDGADLVLVATPISAVPTWVARALPRARVVTDAGSAKRWIEAETRSLAGSERFVSGHPMAGGPQGGAAFAKADLFQDQRWLLCRGNSTPEAFSFVEEFVRSLGGRGVELSAEEHDRAVAVTSHLPQLLASALYTLAHERDALAAVGPGFLSSTRIAGGPKAIWGDILKTNADEVAKATRELMKLLGDLNAGLEAQPTDVDPALDLLERARIARPPRD